MKKFFSIVLATVALVAAPAANAQLRFGAKVGANFSNLNWDNAKDLKFQGTSLTNFTGGVTAEWIFIAGFGVDASVMYTAKGTKYEVSDNVAGDAASAAFNAVFGTTDAVKNTVHYIEVPINLKYKLQLPGVEKIVAPFIYAGPSFAFKVGESIKGLGETVKNSGDLIKNKNFDVAINLGIGVEVIKHVNLAVQYGWGLGTASEIGLKDVVSFNKAKSGAWTVTLGYMF